MWVIADYLPVALFSLRDSGATSSGGRSLLLPTPYAIKMALLDAALRVYGVDVAKASFEHIKRLAIRVRGPERLVVNNSFIKVARPLRADRTVTGENARGRYPFERTVSFRQYVSWHGTLSIAFGIEKKVHPQRLVDLLMRISYLGKRGSFIQYVGWHDHPDPELPAGFGVPIGPELGYIYRDFIIQQMDDMAPGLTFEQVDVTSEAPIRLGKDRYIVPTLFPYRIAETTKGYTYFERTDS